MVNLFMRIIGGRFRGKELKPLDGETRPTTDRVRKTFSIY